MSLATVFVQNKSPYVSNAGSDEWTKRRLYVSLFGEHKNLTEFIYNQDTCTFQDVKFLSLSVYQAHSDIEQSLKILLNIY